MNPLKIVKYGVHFTVPKFMAFVKHFGRNMSFVKKALILFYCMRDPETPKSVKILIMGCLGYLILPADALPDTIAGIGWLDDIAVITAVTQIAANYIKPSHEEMAIKKLPFIRK